MQSFTENFNVFDIYLRIYSHNHNEYMDGEGDQNNHGANLLK